jgi:hypothetical protein
VAPTAIVNAFGEKIAPLGSERQVYPAMPLTIPHLLKTGHKRSVRSQLPIRISNQTLNLLIAIAVIVMVFSTFQILTFDMLGIVWLAWGGMMIYILIICLFIYKVPQRRKLPLVYFYALINFAFLFAAFSLRRHPRALELLSITIAILLITYIAACVVAILYPERRNPR